VVTGDGPAKLPFIGDAAAAATKFEWFFLPFSFFEIR
jgi:hypothetical protein